MSWSYSGDPRATPLDAVRFEIQDVDEKAPLLQDEEIEYSIVAEAPSKEPSESEVLSAAARCMEALARRFRAQADTEIGTLRLDYSKAAMGYEEAAKGLRLRAQGTHAPWAGGLHESEKQSAAQQADKVQPFFNRQQFKSPYGGLGPSILTSGIINQEEG